VPNRGLALLVHLLALPIAGVGCGGSEPPGPRASNEPTIASAAGALAVAVAERTNAARAAYYASEAARYRQVAAQQRQFAQADAQRTAPTTAAAARLTSRKATLEARAAAADQIAARLQPIIDFHTIEAAKEATR
jgi:hypothetical protein